MELWGICECPHLCECLPVSNTTHSVETQILQILQSKLRLGGVHKCPTVSMNAYNLRWEWGTFVNCPVSVNILKLIHLYTGFWKGNSWLNWDRRHLQIRPVSDKTEVIYEHPQFLWMHLRLYVSCLLSLPTPTTLRDDLRVFTNTPQSQMILGAFIMPQSLWTSPSQTLQQFMDTPSLCECPPQSLWRPSCEWSPQQNKRL